MKKVTTILILLLISAFMLTGCAKCIDKKEESVLMKMISHQIGVDIFFKMQIDIFIKIQM